jgi:type VI secretion system secreted protein Hcp
MAIYLKFGNVKGNVTAKGFEKHIAVDSVRFKVTRTVSMESGNLSNRESAKPKLSPITLVKRADSSVAAIFKEAVSGASGQEATLTFVRTGKDGLMPYMSYVLTDCIVSGYDINAFGDTEPSESISLSYSKIVASYTDHDATNKAGTPMRVMYDLAKGEAG